MVIIWNRQNTLASNGCHLGYRHARWLRFLFGWSVLDIPIRRQNIWMIYISDLGFKCRCFKKSGFFFAHPLSNLRQYRFFTIYTHPHFFTSLPVPPIKTSLTIFVRLCVLRKEIPSKSLNMQSFGHKTFILSKPFLCLLIKNVLWQNLLS